MLKNILATTALGTALAAGGLVWAQTTDTEAGEAVEMEGAAEETGETMQEPLVDDPAAAEGGAVEDPAVEAPAAGEAMEAPATEMTGDWVVDEGWTPAETSSLSAEALVGANIRNQEGETIAEVADVVLAADGGIESIAASFGGFLGFGTDTVELTLEEVEIFQDENESYALRTGLTPEDLEGRPQYEEAS